MHDITLSKYHKSYRKGILTIYLHQSASDLCFPTGTAWWIHAGFDCQREEGILHYVSNRKQNTYDFDDEKSSCSQFHSCLYILKHGHTALFTLLIQRFDLLKCRHGDQTTIPRKKEKKLKKSALSKHLLPVWKPELFGRHPKHVYHFWKILYFQMYQFSSKSLSGNAARRCLMICWMWSFRPPKIDSRPVGHTEVSAVRSSQQ